MSEAEDRIIEDIEQARIELDQDLARLNEQVREQLDWHTQLNRHPWLFIACVTVAVVLIVRIVKS